MYKIIHIPTILPVSAGLEDIGTFNNGYNYILDRNTAINTSDICPMLFYSKEEASRYLQDSVGYVKRKYYIRLTRLLPSYPITLKKYEFEIIEHV